MSKLFSYRRTPLYLSPTHEPQITTIQTFKIMSPSTTRWCPTPEQLMILEELYRRGLKTPNASQIQKITAHLSFYGKIQGKNVFYWFQNHKARDRQKLRKKLAKQHQILQHHLHQYHLDPQTRFGTHILDFQTPPLPFLLSSSSYSQESLHAQGATGVCEEAPEGMQSRTWRPDLPKDYLNSISQTIYGYDSMMINMDAGPTFPCCTSSSRTQPLQTLELFPLTATHQETTS